VSGNGKAIYEKAISVKSIIPIFEGNTGVGKKGKSNVNNVKMPSEK
jgi:hypothetical protein